MVTMLDDKDEVIFDDLIGFLKAKYHMEVIDESFPKNRLKYDNLVIDAKYR